jgi:hypothetical protein
MAEKRGDEVEELFELEERGWQALSTGQEEAREFYRPLLSEDSTMVFPGELRLTGKESILASMGALPWVSFRLTDYQALSLPEGGGMVIYRVTAQREGSEPYRALVSSLYLKRQGRWNLVFHQQTPF